MYRTHTPRIPPRQLNENRPFDGTPKVIVVWEDPRTPGGGSWRQSARKRGDTKDI
uniref:Uncharacterized protein n=1 Tax=Arion vulgaris TaxID=1028688 RepID=A0A0B7AFS3_9EUPU